EFESLEALDKCTIGGSIRVRHSAMKLKAAISGRPSETPTGERHATQRTVDQNLPCRHIAPDSPAPRWRMTRSHDEVDMNRMRQVAIALATLSFWCGAIFGASGFANAQDWPSRSVKFIVPLGPGSGTDIGARLISEQLTRMWGQSVVVENRIGGDGIVGIN